MIISLGLILGRHNWQAAQLNICRCTQPQGGFANCRLHSLVLIGKIQPIILIILI